MPSTIFFRGDAQGRAQETHVTPANFAPGKTATLTINGKDITVTVGADTSVTAVSSLLVDSIGSFNNSIPEWKEVSASLLSDSSGNVIGVKLLGQADGTPFTVTSSTTGISTFTIVITEVQKGSASVNHKQRVTLAGPPTSGNFTLTLGGQTTGNIAYSASAATVKTAIELLSTVGSGNTTVTLNGTGDWTIEFVSALAKTNQPPFVGTNVSLAGACSIVVTTKMQGLASDYADGPTYKLTVTPGMDSFRFRFTGGAGYSGLAYYSNFVAVGSTGCSASDIRDALESILAPSELVSDTRAGALPIADTKVYSLVDVTGPVNGPFEILIRAGIASAMTVNDALYIDTPYKSPGVAGDGTETTLTFVSAGAGAGAASVDEVQVVNIVGGPTAGTFTLTFQGQTTAGIAYNCTNYDLRDALCNLSNILGTDEVQTITITGGPTGGTFTVGFTNPSGTSSTSGTIAFNAPAATVQSALQAMPAIGSGGVLCTGGPLNSAAVTCTFRAALGRQNVNQMNLQANSLTGGASPTAAFATTVGGVKGGVSVVSTGAVNQFEVTFQTGGALAATNVQRMAGSAASLTGATINTEVVSDAMAGYNEREEIAMTNTPTGGTFTLTFNSETTAGIAYNATAATVQAALEALATPVPGDVACTGGPLPGIPIMVEFKGQYAESNVATMTANAGSLTDTGSQSLTVAANTVNPTGPHHLDEVENYSGGALPVAGDILVMADIATGIYYGLNGLSGITLGEFHVRNSFSGQLGLLPLNAVGGGNSSYYEYRQRTATIKATKSFVGEGTGNGAAFLNIDFSNVTTELIVYNTGRSPDGTIPNLCVKGTSASNVFRFFKGNWGVGYFVGDLATVSTLQVGYLTDKAGDSTGQVGPGVTLTTAQISGGFTTMDLQAADAVNLTITGGELIVNGTKAFTTTSIISIDANVIFNSIGTWAAPIIVSNKATLDFSQDMRTKTVSNPIDVFSEDVTISDPFKVVSSLVIDLNYMEATINKNIDVGSNVRLTRGTPA